MFPLIVAAWLIVAPGIAIWAWERGYTHLEPWWSGAAVLTGGVSGYLGFVFMSFVLY